LSTPQTIPDAVILERVRYEIEGERCSLGLEKLADISARIGVGMHVAVLQEVYLNRIRDGRKTIESRFTQCRTPPFGWVQAGDILFLKLISGPILAIASVAKTECFGPLEPGQAEEIIEGHGVDLALDDEFREAKRDSKFVTLMHLGPVTSVRPVRLVKRDQRPWVVLPRYQQSRFAEETV
jgi:hypothetical protein